MSHDYGGNMSRLPRLLPIAAVPGVLAALAGCSGLAPASAIVSSTRAAVAPSRAIAATGRAGGTMTPVPSATPASPAVSGPDGGDTYLAESQDLNGTIARKPSCRDGCPLSGDGTVVLWRMTWPSWSGTEAVGTGTEAIESCDPNCAAGPNYRVPVTVTFTRPVKDCTSSGTLWVWTRASFRWPKGLPSALQGGNGPLNPWPFTALRSQAQATCR